MSEPPSGTVAFLFTDIEGSTALSERDPDGMLRSLRVHDDCLKQHILQNSGYHFGNPGDGFCAAFANVTDAVKTAVQSQIALQKVDWHDNPILKVRMGIHLAETQWSDGNYKGAEINRASRICDAANGGQILIGGAACQTAQRRLPEQCTLIHHGNHRLKDLQAPEDLWEVRHSEIPHVTLPIRTPDIHPNNLPRQLTSFIGREREMAEVIRHIEKSPLVTLIGAGGSGKTRLAIQIGAELSLKFPGGVWLVELAPLRNADLVPQAVATALLAKERQDNVVDNILSRLHDCKALILLDNVEHMLDASTALVNRILNACPRVRFLVTGRKPLGLQSEQRYLVPLLNIPGKSDRVSAKRLLQFDSIRLFVDRAQLIDHEFQLDNSNSAAIREICTRLDGIPLAIELAASKLTAMTPQRIASKLGRPFELLKDSNPTTDPRQRTLRAAIAWSYDLLLPSEQITFNKLALFAGSFDCETAAAVAQGGAEIEDHLEALTNASLLTFQRKQGRFSILETIREFAREKLEETGQSELVRDSFINLFAKYSDGVIERLSGSQQSDSLFEIDKEHDNIRESLSLARGTATAVRIAGNMWSYWRIREMHREGLYWLDSVEVPKEYDPKSLAQVYNGAGVLAGELGEFDRALDYHRKALDIRPADDLQGIAASQNNIGLVARKKGDLVLAADSLNQSLELYRRLNHSVGVARALTNLANVHFQSGKYDMAQPLLEESSEFFKKLGDHYNEASVRSNLAQTHLNLGSNAEAGKQIVAAARIGIELGTKVLLAPVFAAAARLLALEREDFWSRVAKQRALQLLDEAEELLSAFDQKIFEEHLSYVPPGEIESAEMPPLATMVQFLAERWR